MPRALAGHVRPGPWPLQGGQPRRCDIVVVLTQGHSAFAAASAARTRQRAPVTLAPPRARSYGVDATSTSYERHGWDIHAVTAGGGCVSPVTAAQRSAAAPGGKGRDATRPSGISVRGLPRRPRRRRPGGPGGMSAAGRLRREIRSPAGANRICYGTSVMPVARRTSFSAACHDSFRKRPGDDPCPAEIAPPIGVGQEGYEGPGSRWSSVSHYRLVLAAFDRIVQRRPARILVSDLVGNAYHQPVTRRPGRTVRHNLGLRKCHRVVHAPGYIREERVSAA